MKQLILLAATLLALTAKLVAEEKNGNEGNHFQKQKTELHTKK